MGPQRPKVLADIPTMMELGYRDVNFQTWIGVLGPLGMPAATVTQLNAAMAKTVRADDAVASIGKLGMEPSVVTPEAYAAIIKADYDLFKKSVGITGFKAED